MRQRLKLILFAALSAALTVAGLSLAAGGGSSGSKDGDTAGTWDVKRGFGGPGSHMRLDEDLADVMHTIHEAVEKKAPEIAEPIIAKAEDAGDITGAQADQLRAAAKSIADGERPDGDVRALLRDKDVRKVVRDSFAAAHKQTPAIAEPILDKAVDDQQITSAQADDIREKLKNPPRFFHGRGFKHGHGPGGPGGPGHLGNIDQDVADVVRDIHEAVENQAPEIAEPVIAKAEDAGDITGAQADQLRTAAKSIADGKRPDGDLRALLRDEDVRKVVGDAFAAAHKQAPAIAEPILDKAVADKQITSAQADDIRAKLKQVRSLRAGPPRFGGPPHFEGPPPFGGPGGPHKGGQRPAVLVNPA